MFWRVVRTPAAERDPQAIAAAVTTLEQKLAIAEARLAGSRYLVGDTFTRPTSSLVMCCTATLPSISPSSPPHLAAYYARLTARPAFRQHVMVSYDELKV